jgi:hypothetical protein
MGLRMMGTLVGWWIYELTNDPFAIGLIGLSEVIPAVSLSLYAGHVIDISEKRKPVIERRGLIFFVRIDLTGTFHALYIYPDQQSLDRFQYLCDHFFTGIFRAFTGPTFGVMVASIVPKEILQNATTWNQGTWLAASVTGHATVGFLIAGSAI